MGFNWSLEISSGYEWQLKSCGEFRATQCTHNIFLPLIVLGSPNFFKLCIFSESRGIFPDFQYFISYVVSTVSVPGVGLFILNSLFTTAVCTCRLGEILSLQASCWIVAGSIVQVIIIRTEVCCVAGIFQPE